MSIEERIEYNHYKLIADKIRKTLTNIRNVPGISSKRWIGELIQNAKDVKNNFNKVSIKIEIDNKYLKFSHNGTYFTIDNVLGLLQQVSSKDSKNEEDQTGKFGTGFIGTHLLSNIINIYGIIYYEEVYRKFKIHLDRSADSSEKLLKEVKNSINNFKKNMTIENSEYKILDNYKQEEKDFDTVFEYILENEENLKIANDGISDLINTAPVTLATQFKKISSILIIDKIKNETIEYTVNCSNKSKNKNLKKINLINFSTITIKKTKNRKISEEKLYFYSCENNVCRLLYQVDKIGNEFCVHERGNKQPILFRDFPLIGSENFHFPFFLDGFKFNPLETRNGLYLNGNLNSEAKENREIIKNGIELSVEFCKFFLKQNIDKKYLLSISKIPEPPQKYDKYAIDWFIEQQKNWRSQLSELELLLDGDTYSELNLLKLPVFKKEYNINFLKLFENMNITEGIIPIEKEVELWYNIMENDPLKKVYEIEENTWGFKYLFDEEDLFLKIQKYESVSKFAEDMNKTTGEIYDWLNKLYNFLKINKFNDCYYNYNMIPNQNGIFKKIYELFGNDENRIDINIESLYKKIFNIDLNDIILNENIKLSNFGNLVKIKNIKNIFNEFSDLFKETNDDNNSNNDKKLDNQKKCLVDHFLSFDINNKKIGQMFKFRSETDINYINKVKIEIKIPYTLKSHNIWREIEEYWFDYHSNIIESQENLEQLKKLLTKEKDKSNPLIWLNGYISFLKMYSTIISKKKIFPNQNGIFKLLENIQYDDSIPELFKEILNNLKRIYEKNYDIRDILLSKEIISYNNYNKFAQKEVISQIENLFIKKEEIKEKQKKENEVIDQKTLVKTYVAEKIITFVPNPNFNPKKYKPINESLEKIIEYYNIIQKKDLKIYKSEIAPELNYGIFVKYILKLIIKNIEKMTPEKVKDNKEIIPKIIKFAYDYQYTSLGLSVDPKKYKIFANQNNELKVFDQIYYRDWKYNIEMENYLFELSKNPLINKDYNQDILSFSFEKDLETYKNNFKSLKLKEICQTIDNKIIQYYHKNEYSNYIKNDTNFIKAFYSLNEFLKNYTDLKKYFPQFNRSRQYIAFNFSDENEKDTFIGDIMKKVMDKTKTSKRKKSKI